MSPRERSGVTRKPQKRPGAGLRAFRRPCTSCEHPKRVEAEGRVAKGEPVDRVAREFRLSPDGFPAHLVKHAPKVIELARQAIARRDLASGLALSEEMADLQLRTLAILTKAEHAKKLTLALAAIREARANHELLGKWNGKSSGTFHLVQHPDWAGHRERLMRFIALHPELRADFEREVLGRGEAAVDATLVRREAADV